MGRRGRGLPVAARGHGHADRRRRPFTAARVLELLGLDERNPSSVAGALAAARENARGARETISVGDVGVPQRHLARLPDARRTRRSSSGVHAFFRWVRERCAVLAGLADATMSRDDGWLFLVLGRSLERVDMTARLLSHARAGRRQHPVLADPAALLRRVGDVPAHVPGRAGRPARRRVPAAGPAVPALGVRTRCPPPSRCLADLEPARACRRAGPGSRPTRSRIVGRARTDLEFRGADELLDDLPAVLAGLRARPARRSTTRSPAATSGRPRRSTWAHEAVA